jgi:hypothetical protein
MSKENRSQEPEAHSYNPNFLRGSDQEDCSSKSAPANSSQDRISKKSNTKQGWQSGLSGRVPAYQV